jgi:tetratricopeptide (TPR) repeat protein
MAHGTKQLATRLVEHAEAWSFERAQLRRIDLTPDGTEGILYVRAWLSNGAIVKMRWWVIRHGDRWRVYDSEDLATSLRMSVLMATVFTAIDLPPAEAHALLRDAQLIGKAGVCIREERYGDVVALLQHASLSRAPPVLRAVREYFLGMAALADGDFRLALNRFEFAKRLHSDMVILGYLRAVIANHEERFADAVREAEQYLQAFGTDADATCELVHALQALERDDEALAAARAGLDDDPSSTDLLLMLAPLLPGDGQRELGDRFLKLHDPSAAFETVCQGLLDDPGAVLSVVAAYRTINPQDPNIAYYGAHALLQQGHAEEAFDLLATALPTTTTRDDHDAFVHLFASAALTSDAVIDAYVLAEDKSAMFRALGTCFLEADDFDRELLHELVEKHEAAFPNDPEPMATLGQVALGDGDWKGAIDCFRRAMRLAADDQSGRFRYSLVIAQFHGGEAIDALRTVGPAAETFRQLMWLAFLDADPPDVELMRSLVAEFEPGHENDPAVAFWKIRLACDAGEYHDAVALMTRHAIALAEDEEFEQTWPFLKVNLLVALERYDEAAREARAYDEQYEDPILQAVVSAARGHVEQTAHWIEKCLETGYSAEDLYETDGLGASLRRPEFESLREKYPPPDFPGSSVQDDVL